MANYGGTMELRFNMHFFERLIDRFQVNYFKKLPMQSLLSEV